MRLLYISHSFPLPGQPLSNVGGMQRVAVGLHDALRAHPEVELTSHVLETSWERTPARMVPFMTRLLAEIPRTVRRERIDVVLFSSMVTATHAVALRATLNGSDTRLAAIPVGRDVTLPTRAYQWLLPRVFSALDRAFPISRATGRECLARGLAAEKMEVVPCGVDPRLFSAPADREAARAELLRMVGERGGGVGENALLVASVGRLQRRKGFHWFVDAVVSRLPDDVHYLLAGKGAMEGEIRAAISRHDLGDRVHLLGRVSEEELRSLYRGSDLFAMPNIPVEGDIEGFGVVMLEAALSGLPVLAADIEGIRDVVLEGENGHLLPSGDAEAFVSRILDYHPDRERLVEASERAARHTADSFSWSAIADRFVEALAPAAGAGIAQPREAA